MAAIDYIGRTLETKIDRAYSSVFVELLKALRRSVSCPAYKTEHACELFSCLTSQKLASAIDAPTPRSNAHDCYYFDDIYLMTVVVVFGSVPMLFIARSLIHVFDAFRIRQEMERVIGICSILARTWIDTYIYRVSSCSTTFDTVGSTSPRGMHSCRDVGAL